jgi:hypothetical protein
MKIGTVGGIRVGTDSTGSKELRTVPYTRTPPNPYPYRTHRTASSDSDKKTDLAPKETAATIAAAASKDDAGKAMVLLAKDRAVRLLGCEKRVQLINSFWV